MGRASISLLFCLIFFTLHDDKMELYMIELHKAFGTSVLEFSET